MALIIKELTYVHPDGGTLFDRLDLSLSKGQKTSLVGDNGVGKSTLLKLIAGQLQPSGGRIVLPEKPWYIPQHLGQFDEMSVAQALQVDRKLQALEALLSGEADIQLYADLDDDWEIDKKVADALARWSIGDLAPQRLLGTLSGGQKTKVFLAGIDLHMPGMILMDEPTNHLDARSRQQLYECIDATRSSLLVVSHDRSLLNLLPETLELNGGAVDLYGGNFDFYQSQKALQVAALQAQLDEQTRTYRQTQKKAREMVESRQKKEARGRTVGQSNSLPRIIAGGLQSKAEQSTAKMIDAHGEKLEGIAGNIRELTGRIGEYQALKIDIGHSDLHRGKLLIDAKDIEFRYGSDPLSMSTSLTPSSLSTPSPSTSSPHTLPSSLWLPLTFQIRSGDRVHLTGDNGVGKSTLVQLITGRLLPRRGQLLKADFSYGMLDQDYSMISDDLTLYEQVQQCNSRGMQEHELKSWLTHCQFDAHAFDRKCEDLSGGEKMKLSLCCLAVSLQTPDMLILDEPANNLDIKSLEVLARSIRTFKGTLLLISHDAHFVETVGITSRIKPDINFSLEQVRIS